MLSVGKRLDAFSFPNFHKTLSVLTLKMFTQVKMHQESCDDKKPKFPHEDKQLSNFPKFNSSADFSD